LRCLGSSPKALMATSSAAARVAASNELRPSPGSALWVRAPSPPRSRIRAHSGRARILQPGSGWSPDKIQPGANRSLGRFPSRARPIVRRGTGLHVTGAVQELTTPTPERVVGPLTLQHSPSSRTSRHSSPVPIPDSCSAAKQHPSAINIGGTSRPSVLAVLRLTTRSNLVGCSTGMSLGFVPCRILSTNSAVWRNRFGTFVHKR
jgi:hypothetical protein